MTRTSTAKTGKPASFDKFTHIVSKLGANAATLALFLIMIVTVVDVVSRSVFVRSVPGLIESAEVILVAAAFVGLGYAQRMKAHVSTSFFVELLPATAGRRIRRAGMVVLALYIGAAAVVSAQRAWDAFQGGEVRFGLIQIPQWPARAAIAIGFAILFLEVVRDLRRPLLKHASHPDMPTGSL